MRYGFDYEHLDFSQLQQYTGPTFTAPNGQQTATGAIVDIIPDPVYGQIYHVDRASLTAARPTTQHYGALFVEDEWKIGNSLTIRPGVRYEQETLSGTLVKDFSLKNNWAPRIGVVWDPTRQRRGEGVRATTAATTRACRAISPPARCRPTRRSPPTTSIANLTQPVPDGTVTTNATDRRRDDDALHAARRGRDDIDPNAKLSYYNEWVAGTEYTLTARARHRGPLRAPRHRSRARRRAAVPDRGDCRSACRAPRRRTTC